MARRGIFTRLNWKRFRKSWIASISLKRSEACGGGMWSIPMPGESPLKGFGILTPLQREFLEVFARLPDQSQFYLTGGTALAEYYLGHRLSFDLDFFTGVERLIAPTSYQIEAVCQQQALSLRVVRRFSAFVEFLIEKGGESLKIDLALAAPYRFEPPIPAPEGVLVNDYSDLRVDK